MIANKIPSVLFQPNSNSLSIERVLRLAQRLILEGRLSDDDQRVLTCWDDLETIIQNLER